MDTRRAERELKQSNEVVYAGTANDPEQCEQEPRDDGKKFGRMNVMSRRMTKDGAKNGKLKGLPYTVSARVKPKVQ